MATFLPNMFKKKNKQNTLTQDEDRIERLSRSFLSPPLPSQHNYAHGDLHPGNILVRDAAVQNPAHGNVSLYAKGGGARHPQLVMLDAGIVVELEDTDRDSLLQLFGAIVKGDSVCSSRAPRMHHA